ncbi:PIG-L deacetylase family protein [Ilumatobacter sp.]|uniref:PIG-L deacetylase family protein n=1 Tax=Ilumatobacter sp. TaxID=1967498 RepID=UPI003AF83BBD
MSELQPFPDDWERALAVVAHPDDMEYGAASAVARWTAEGKHVAYLLVTRGEAGIATMPPDEVTALRAVEQRNSCAAVGVDVLEYLDHPDGLVVEGLDLRRDLAAAIRRHRPDVVISINHHDSWGGPSWNHADHRAVGRALLDAVRDAGNRWLFAEAGEPWDGTRFVAFNASPSSTHAVDVGDHIDAGIASLRCHEVYLAALDGDDDPDTFLRASARSVGESFGCDYATAFEIIGGA